MREEEDISIQQNHSKESAITPTIYFSFSSFHNSTLSLYSLTNSVEQKENDQEQIKNAD